MLDIAAVHPTGAFATAALQLHAMGLAPIPCSADDDGKVPGVATRHWKHRPGVDRLRQLALRFPEQNVGILTGLSRVTVVDVDEAGLAADMLRRFGHTPLIVETPSGTIHLYYRANGERCANLRRPEQLPVDIKGIGGFVVVPPSRRPSGPHAGKLYSIVQGRWEDVARLPTIKAGAIRPPAAARPDATPDAMPDGTRHKALLSHALRQARACDTVDALLDILRWINERKCIPPLPDGDVIKAARQAWKYQQEGRNYGGGVRHVFTFADEFEAFRRAPKGNGGDAMMLLGLLRWTHFSGDPFALSPRAMAHAAVITGWGERQYRDARALLLELGYVVQLCPGGRGPRNPALFNFGPKIPDPLA